MYRTVNKYIMSTKYQTQVQQLKYRNTKQTNTKSKHIQPSRSCPHHRTRQAARNFHRHNPNPARGAGSTAISKGSVRQYKMQTHNRKQRRQPPKSHISSEDDTWKKQA